MPKQQHYRPDTFQLRDSIGYLQKRASRLMQERIEMLFASHDCTLQQWMALMQVRDGAALTIADLSRALHHDSGAMTRLIDQLESRDLLKRHRNVQDRRIIELSLTLAGRQLLDQLIPIACDMLNSTVEGFSRSEVEQLQELLRRVMARLEEAVGSA